MHPLIARFLNVDAALTALDNAANASSLDDSAKAFVAAAAREPARKAAIISARGKAQAPLEAQQALILLATDAATDVLQTDPTFKPLAELAMTALTAEGATEAEAKALLASAVLEEAFGFAEDPDEFDQPYLLETFASLASLAKVTESTVDGWLEAFAASAPAPQRPLRLTVAETLLTAAFAEGPQPITLEHVDDALDALAQKVASAELEKASQTLVEFLKVLSQNNIIGPMRLERLTELVHSAAAGDLAEGDDELDDGDDDEEPGDGFDA